MSLLVTLAVLLSVLAVRAQEVQHHVFAQSDDGEVPIAVDHHHHHHHHHDAEEGDFNVLDLAALEIALGGEEEGEGVTADADADAGLAHYQARFEGVRVEFGREGSGDNGVHPDGFTTLRSFPVDEDGEPYRFGPALLISKTSSGSVVDDSFDGDKDGQLDVLETHDRWAEANGILQRPIEDFVAAVRHRAQSNGGSIALKALTITPIGENGDNFQVIDENHLMISQCFSVYNNEDFNLEIFMGSLGFSDSFSEDGGSLIVPRPADCNGTDNVRVADCEGDNLIYSSAFYQDGEWLDQTAWWVMERESGSFLQHEAVATVYFEKCTQFSYFI